MTHEDNKHVKDLRGVSLDIENEWVGNVGGRGYDDNDLYIAHLGNFAEYQHEKDERME